MTTTYSYEGKNFNSREAARSAVRADLADGTYEPVDFNGGSYAAANHDRASGWEWFGYEFLEGSDSGFTVVAVRRS